MQSSKLLLGVGAMVVGVGAAVLMMPSEQNSNQTVSQSPSATERQASQQPVNAQVNTASSIAAEPTTKAVPAKPAGEIPLPEPAPALPEVDPNEITNMWKSSEQEQTTDENGIPTTHLQVNPQLISSLQLGQTYSC